MKQRLPKAIYSPFRRSDTRELTAMILALYRESPTGQKMSLAKIRRTIAEFTARPDKGAITIVRCGGRIVGYYILVYFWSNEYGGNIVHVDELFIKPRWRSKGLGAACLRHIAALPVKNLRGLHLETAPDNLRARAFYAREGFGPPANLHLFRKV